MRTHLRLGRLIGVPIGINWGVLLVSVLLAFSLAEASLPAVAPDHPTSAYWFAAIVGVVAFLVSLVGHELGHSYIAKRNGVNVVEITLWLFGGVAKLEGDADDPGAEFRIALAGPVMSLVCAVVAGGFAWLVEDLGGSRVLVGLLIWLSAINVVLAVSNLIPAFPLDGGRMLRAVLWRRSTHKRRATRQASLIGQLLAGVMIVGAVVLAVRSSLWSGVWLIALGLFLLVAARSEWNAAAAQPELMLAPVGDLARSLPTPLGPRASVADVEGALDAHTGGRLRSPHRRSEPDHRAGDPRRRGPHSSGPAGRRPGDLAGRTAPVAPAGLTGRVGRHGAHPPRPGRDVVGVGQRRHRPAQRVVQRRRRRSARGRDRLNLHRSALKVDRGARSSSDGT